MLFFYHYFFYTRIFNTHSEIKYLWIFASNLETEEEMLKNSQFCYHAKKLGDSLNNVVTALTSPSETVDFSGIIDLFKLGRHHCKYGVKEPYYTVRIFIIKSLLYRLIIIKLNILKGFSRMYDFCSKENDRRSPVIQ